ncbi:hypothetical protein ES707_03375 [subsurface metagenome]
MTISRLPGTRRLIIGSDIKPDEIDTEHLKDGAVTGPKMKYPATSPITMAGGGLVYLELRPDLDFETIRGNVGIPTLVTRGIFRGFSLPLYVAKEELFATICIPNRYDGASDLFFHLYCWLALPEDAKNFKLELAWEHYTPVIDAVPNTETLVPMQTATGADAAQYQSYGVTFTIDYDVHVSPITADDILALRVRRLAADAAECAGEIVINHYGVILRRDKLGTPIP